MAGPMFPAIAGRSVPSSTAANTAAARPTSACLVWLWSTRVGQVSQTDEIQLGGF